MDVLRRAHGGRGSDCRVCRLGKAGAERQQERGRGEGKEPDHDEPPGHPFQDGSCQNSLRAADMTMVVAL